MEFHIKNLKHFGLELWKRVRVVIEVSCKKTRRIIFDLN